MLPFGTPMVPLVGPMLPFGTAIVPLGFAKVPFGAPMVPFFTFIFQPIVGSEPSKELLALQESVVETVTTETFGTPVVPFGTVFGTISSDSLPESLLSSRLTFIFVEVDLLTGNLSEINWSRLVKT